MSQYVKFTYQRARANIGPFNTLAELNACRRKLLELRLIGLDSNGIGFGNLSVREGASRNFYITGSATGGGRFLTALRQLRSAFLTARVKWRAESYACLRKPMCEAARFSLWRDTKTAL